MKQERTVGKGENPRLCDLRSMRKEGHQREVPEAISIPGIYDLRWRVASLRRGP